MAMEPLMEGKFLGGEYVPRLATDYNVSPDGKTVTFKLAGREVP
jgi:ABC-type transport system substrate-binding protein